MAYNRNSLMKALIFSSVVVVLLTVWHLLPVFLGDRTIELEMILIILFWAICIFVFLTIFFYIGLNDYRKTKNVWSGARSALYFRAKMRIYSFVGLAIILGVFYPLYFLTKKYIPSYSILISASLTILIVSFFGIFLYRRMTGKAKEREEEWEKLEADKKRIRERILNETK